MPYDDATRAKLLEKLVNVAPKSYPQDQKQQWSKSVLETISTVEDGGTPPVGVEGAVVGTGVDGVLQLFEVLFDKGVVRPPAEEKFAARTLEFAGNFFRLGEVECIAAFQVAIGMAPTGKLNAAVARRMRAYIAELQ